MKGPLVGFLDVGGLVDFDPLSDCCVSFAAASAEVTFRRLTDESVPLYLWSSAWKMSSSSLSPHIFAGDSDRALLSDVAGTWAMARPFLSSRKSSPPAVSLEPFTRWRFGVPRPLLGDRDEVVANCVIRDWREVAPGGVSVFWKKLRILELRWTDDCRAAAGDLDGVDAFFPYEPAIFDESSGRGRGRRRHSSRRKV